MNNELLPNSSNTSGKDTNNNYNVGFTEDYFKEALKNYLVERNLFESEEPVSKEQMKKNIFGTNSRR